MASCYCFKLWSHARALMLWGHAMEYMLWSHFEHVVSAHQTCVQTGLMSDMESCYGVMLWSHLAQKTCV